MKNFVGLYGLGVMGQSLALNIAKHDYTVSVFNINTEVTKKFAENRIGNSSVFPYFNIKDFIDSLDKPRKIILMVTAGKAVDEVIDSLLPYLEEDDMVMDCGNSYYKDTIKRESQLRKSKVYFFGIGISGGEKGALNGPSIMPGGDAYIYDKYLKGMFNKIAAHTKSNEPCCNYIGGNGSGHFVKMVHNGIEYGDIEIICEAYQLMKSVAKMTNEEMADVFDQWNHGRLNSYLIEITAKILRKKDEVTNSYLIDKILDKAKQKGTGKWTSMESLDIGVAIPTIAESVFARYMSAQKDMRVYASSKFCNKPSMLVDKAVLLDSLEKAVYVSKIISYAQGFCLLRAASEEYEWSLNLGEIALLWREGCIIRAQFLEDIEKAFSEVGNKHDLLLSERFSNDINDSVPGLRSIVVIGVQNATYIPAITNSLLYFDGLTSRLLPANLIQAQRDWFGAHTYQRIDRPEKEFFHTEWE